MARITLNIVFFNVIPGKHPSYLEMLKVPWPFTIYLSTTPLICWICKLHWFASLGVPKHINYWGHTCAHLFFLIFLKVADSSLTKGNRHRPRNSPARKQPKQQNQATEIKQVKFSLFFLNLQIWSNINIEYSASSYSILYVCICVWCNIVNIYIWWRSLPTVDKHRQSHVPNGWCLPKLWISRDFAKVLKLQIQ